MILFFVSTNDRWDAFSKKMFSLPLQTSCSLTHSQTTESFCKKRFFVKKWKEREKSFDRIFLIWIERRKEDFRIWNQIQVNEVTRERWLGKYIDHFEPLKKRKHIDFHWINDKWWFDQRYSRKLFNKQKMKKSNDLIWMKFDRCH